MTLPFDLEIQTGTIVIVILGFLCVMILCVFFLRLRRWMRAALARRRHELDREEMRRRWGRIEQMMRSSDAETARLAVIEADSLLDFVLKSMHVPGQSFAHRLQFLSKKYFELKRVRWAHNLRNRLVHEHDAHLKRNEAVAAVKEYERALKVLGAL